MKALFVNAIYFFIPRLGRVVVVLCAGLFISGEFSYANQEITIDKIGKHFPIFTVEKSENPQNILIAFTKIDSDCRFESNPDRPSEPVFDFYWKMDRTRYKPVHPLIKNGIRDRLALIAPGSDQRRKFSVKIGDLSELKHDLSKAELDVEAVSPSPHICEVRSLIKLGESDHGRTLLLSTLHIESKKVFFPPFRKVVSVTLNGNDSETGEKLSRTYFAP